MIIEFKNILKFKEEPFELFYLMRKKFSENFIDYIEHLISNYILPLDEIKNYIREKYNFERTQTLKIDNYSLYEAKTFAHKASLLFKKNHWVWGGSLTPSRVPNEEEIFNRIKKDMNYLVEKQENMDFSDCGRIFIHTYDYWFHFYLAIN